MAVDMSRKRYSPEQIITLLRESGILKKANPGNF